MHPLPSDLVSFPTIVCLPYLQVCPTCCLLVLPLPLPVECYSSLGLSRKFSSVNHLLDSGPLASASLVTFLSFKIFLQGPETQLRLTYAKMENLLVLKASCRKGRDARKQGSDWSHSFPGFSMMSSASAFQTLPTGRACGGCALTLVYSFTSREEGLCFPNNSWASPRKDTGTPRSDQEQRHRIGPGPGPGSCVFGSFHSNNMVGQGQEAGYTISKRIGKVWWKDRTLATNDRVVLSLRIDYIWLWHTLNHCFSTLDWELIKGKTWSSDLSATPEQGMAMSDTQ